MGHIIVLFTICEVYMTYDIELNDLVYNDLGS